MRLVHNNCKTFSICCYLLYIYKWEFLQCTDNDSLALFQCRGQLTCILIHTHNNSGFMFHIKDVTLQLLIQHFTVCNYDNAVKYHFVIGIMQVFQMMCKPCNRVRLAGTCWVLYQIIASATIFINLWNQVSDRIQLMIAREYQLFFTCILVLFQLNESMQDIKQTVFLQYLLPKIWSTIITTCRRISCSIVVTSVKWNKHCIQFLQLSSHPHLFCIHCKMD